MIMAEEKIWGKHKFWGVGYEWDPQWVLTDEQKEIQRKLIELCRRKIRPKAIEIDKTYEFPRESLDALADLGLLGLIVPKSLGGLGENHVCAAMIIETIARYGCPSTAMVYVMHMGAVATLLFRYHNNERVKNILRRLDKDKLVGTLSYSDPATGGHYWFPLSSKVRDIGESYRMLKYASWTTSAGCADWYALQTVSPNAQGDYSNLSVFLIYGNEIRANTDDWSSLGLHGNQSGPLVLEGVFNKDRLIGPVGDGALSNDECVDPYFYFCSASCWNGISMGAIDIAKKHVTRKAHADVGIRVCDYPTIRDYFGEVLSDTNMCRMGVFNSAQAMDKLTNNNDWSLHQDLTYAPRAKLLHWLWQVKFSAAKNVDTATTKMLHACGGTGYKTDLGLERYLRDGKAGWVMGPSNEVMRQWIGKGVLLGLESVDFWELQRDERVFHQELKKLNLSEKQQLAEELLREVEQSSKPNKANEYQNEEFDNPFNTKPPKVLNQVMKSSDGVSHKPGLNPDTYTSLKLTKVTPVSDKMSAFLFALSNPTDHLGCLPGQYVQIRIPAQDGYPTQERFFSPVSQPQKFGEVEIVLRYETRGILSQYFKKLQPGAEVEFRGPLGGFEYEANSIAIISLVASGGGITPCLQLIRTIIGNPDDKTKVILLYYSENYDEILFKKELDEYEKDPRLTVVHSLGEAPEDWNGEEGFLDSEMVKKYIPTSNGKTHKLVMCGGPTMILSILYSLKDHGVKSEQIFVFGAFGAEQVQMVYGRNCALSTHQSS